MSSTADRIEEIAERVLALKLTPDELIIFASFHVFISRFFGNESPDYLNAVRKFRRDREPLAAIKAAAETILTPAKEAKIEEWKRIEKLNWRKVMDGAAWKLNVAELVKAERLKDPFITNKALGRIVKNHTIKIGDKEIMIAEGYSDESIRQAVLAAPTKKKKGGKRAKGGRS